MKQNSRDDDVKLEEDPVFRHCLRETRFILALWCCCFVYTVTFCYSQGYLSHEPLPSSTGPGIASVFGPLTSWNRSPESLTYPLGLGIPDWVFYGIVLPWLVCLVISIIFCAVFFVEDDLTGPAPPDESDQDKDAQ